MRRPSARAALVTVLLLSGCQLGPRPTLQPNEPIADQNVAVLVTNLHRSVATTFTAEYTITPTTTGEPTKAKVVNKGGTYRVTIGTVGYATNGSESQTCTSTSCESGFNDAYVSDLNVTHRFWGASAESRLRLDAKRNVGAIKPSTKDIAGQQAPCVEIPLSGGTVEYCTVPNGPLARYRGADVVIELTSYTPTVNPDTFSSSATPTTLPGDSTLAPTVTQPASQTG